MFIAIINCRSTYINHKNSNYKKLWESGFMAMIKCPECNADISDKAEACPKCGYELKKAENKETTGTDTEKKEKKFKGKIDYKYIIIGLLVIVVGFYMLNQQNIFKSGKTGNASTVSGQTNSTQGTTQPGTASGTSGTGTTTPGTNAGFVVFNDPNIGMSYEIPSSYKTFIESKTKLSYVGQNIDDNGALIPYILLGWSNYSDPVQFLNAFTEELKKQYNDVEIVINLVSNQLGNYYVYGIQYQYTSSGHIVIDNRYATVINGKVLMVATREENVNTQTINDVTRAIFNTLKGGN